MLMGLGETDLLLSHAHVELLRRTVASVMSLQREWAPKLPLWPGVLWDAFLA